MFGWFTTDNDPPSLSACIQQTQLDIRCEFNDRVVPLDPTTTFEAVWLLQCKAIDDEREVATRLHGHAQIFKAMGYVEEVHHLIQLAMLFLLEAKIALDKGKPEVAWPALARSNYYLGMSSSHPTQFERTSRGGRLTSARIDPLRTMVLDMLKAMPDNSRASRQVLWDEIVPAMQEFGAGQQSPRGMGNRAARSTNPRQLLQRWSNSDPLVRPEFARVSASPLNTRAAREKP